MRGAQNDGNVLRVGLGYGFSVQGSFDETSTDDGTEWRFSEPTQTRPNLVPEVGVVSPSGRRRTEYALRYVVHLDRTPAWTLTASNADGGAIFTATDDHVAFVVRWYFGFRKKCPPPLPCPTIDRSNLAVARRDTLFTHRDRLVLRLSDNAEYDGDTLSLLLNGKPVLVAHELTHKPKRVVLYLERRANTLTVLAHNEGRVPPNTALCAVRTGRGRQRLQLRTGLRAAQEVVLIRGTDTR